jgi:ABC-type tungstate transport system permease subunit
MAIWNKVLKTGFLTAVILLVARFVAEGAGLVEPDGHKRVRAAECFNEPSAQLLLMKLDAAFRSTEVTLVAWQTLASVTDEDYEKLDDVMVISTQDILISGSEEYALKLEKRELLIKKTPLWKERLILVGPADAAEYVGTEVSLIMKEAAARNLLFFSRVRDDGARGAEEDLWKKAGVESLAENSGYVETSRDDLSALMQAGDEGAFMLAGEGSYAQYVDAERYEPALIKIADTEYFRVAYACLTSNSGFRKIRSEGAEKLLEWLTGPEGKKEIAEFSIGGLNPFVPYE